jgi:hypothetical protein
MSNETKVAQPEIIFFWNGNPMIKPANKSKKTQTITVQQQSGQVTALQPIQDIAQPKMAIPVTLAHEEIARRAYEIYVEQGRPQGQSEQIWQQAERDIRNRSKTGALSR